MIDPELKNKVVLSTGANNIAKLAYYKCLLSQRATLTNAAGARIIGGAEERRGRRKVGLRKPTERGGLGLKPALGGSRLKFPLEPPGGTGVHASVVQAAAPALAGEPVTLLLRSASRV